ncbi:MAG: hypothetical protein ABUK01_17395 [Leptospirales bacterium]
MQSILKFMKAVTIFAAIFTFSTFSLSAKTTYGYSGLTAGEQAAFDTYFDDEAANTESGDLTNSYASFAAGMPGAALASTNGLGVSYGPGPKVAVFGFDYSLGISDSTGSYTDLFSKGPGSVEGVGSNLSIMAGMNLGVLPVPFLSKMKVYINFMAMTLPLSNVGSISFLNFGINIQYSILDDVPIVPGLMTWGGLRVTTGYRLTTMDVSFSKVALGNYQVTSGLTWQPKATMSSQSDVSSIPVEVSSSFDLIFITFFGGLGLDFNFGSTDFTVKAEGGFKESNGTAWVKTTKTIQPTAVDYRLFGGVQINIFAVKLVTQFNWAPSSDSYGILGGLRVAF